MAKMEKEAHMAHSSNRHASRKGIRAGLAILTAGPRYLLQPQLRQLKKERHDSRRLRVWIF